MSDKGRWIKWYSLEDWEWADDPYMVAFWSRFLPDVNAQDTRWHGKIIKRGQKWTSIHALADRYHMTRNTIKRILRNLEDTGSIRVESSEAGTLITVLKYELYQADTRKGSRSGSTNDPQNNQGGSPSGSGSGSPSGSTNDPKQEYKNIEEEIVVDYPPAHAKDEFCEIENPNTSSAELVMMRLGWTITDYLNAVRDFKMTCAADGTKHETPEAAASHFRNWTAKRYRYGQRPLSVDTPEPATANDKAFADFYRSTFGTDYVWQNDTTQAVQRIAAAIADKISEQGDISDPAEMPTNIRAFLDAAHRLGDEWLNEHFTPQTLSKQFNELYNRIKNGNTATQSRSRKGRGNATGVSDDYLAAIARDLGGGL